LTCLGETRLSCPANGAYQGGIAARLGPVRSPSHLVASDRSSREGHL
jgi:hypothetical protein